MTDRKRPIQTEVARHSVDNMAVDRTGLFSSGRLQKAYGPTK